jgi:hypothetical protein
LLNDALAGAARFSNILIKLSLLVNARVNLYGCIKKDTGSDKLCSDKTPKNKFFTVAQLCNSIVGMFNFQGRKPVFECSANSYTSVLSFFTQLSAMLLV